MCRGARDRYEALGYVAAIGQRAPSVHIIQCVRADAAMPGSQGLLRPLVQLPAFRGRKPMAAWLTDEQLATFVVTTDGRSPMRQNVKQLAMLHENDEALTARNSQIEAGHLALPLLADLDIAREGSAGITLDV